MSDFSVRRHGSVMRASACALVGVLLLGSLSVLEAQTPQKDPAAADIERVQKDYVEAYQQKDWPRAVELCLEFNRLVPDNSRHQYNLGCVYSLNGEPDKAVKWLNRAAANGFSLLRLFENDSDLDNVRSHPGYLEALAVVKETRAKELVALRAKFENVPMHVVLPPNFDKDKATPLIVALHGKGGRATGIAGQWRKLAAEMGAILIAPQAVTRHGGGFSWNKADTNYDYGDNAEFLLGLTVEFASKNYRIDWDRAVLTGFSEGGAVCRSVGPRPPHVFAGVIPMGCDYLPEFDKPTPAVGSRAPRFYFMAGALDPVVPADQQRLAAKDFTAAGFETEYFIYPNVGHAFPLNRDEELRKAVEFVLQR